MIPPIIRVLLIGSSPLAAQASAHMRCYPELIVNHLVGPSAYPLDYQGAAAAFAPDVILIETLCLALPDCGGLTALMQMAPVVLLGNEPDEDLVLEGLKLGARGHIDWPTEGCARLPAAIRTVVSGSPALSPRITAHLLSHLRRQWLQDALHTTRGLAVQRGVAG